MKFSSIYKVKDNWKWNNFEIYFNTKSNLFVKVTLNVSF